MIFDEIFNYELFPIDIMKFVRSVMIRIILLKTFHSIVVLSLTSTSTLDRLFTDHIFLWFEEVLMLRPRQNFAGNCHIKTQ